jgi:hypothetical protein
LIDEFIGKDFFLKFMLPKSWFYLIKENKIDSNKIKTILEIKWLEEPLIKEKQLKESLYDCIAKIATCKNMNAAQRKNMLSNMKNTFRFQSDEEMAQLYKSYIKIEKFDGEEKKDQKKEPKKSFFESMIITCVMQKLGMSKRHMLEDMLMKRDPDRVLIYYCEKHFLNAEFFMRTNKTDEANNSSKIVLDALEFLNKELKKNPSV